MTPETKLLQDLGYADSPCFFGQDRLSELKGSQHLVRRARETCGLQGIYALQRERNADNVSYPEYPLPLVYVCKAPSEAEADAIHRRVWNQNVVPFLLVLTPRHARLYASFDFSFNSHESQHGRLIVPPVPLAEAHEPLRSLSSQAIDTGDIWRQWGSRVTPERRVDSRLLDSLDRLDRWLLNDGLTDQEIGHALIGKYVYFHYLRQRGILSDRRFGDWGLDPRTIFSRQATLKGFVELTDCLDNWLNGSIFPLSRHQVQAIGQQRLRQVAAVFSGDSTAGQLHLDFDAFDFAHIPIETLSVVYEQFLHSKQVRADKTLGQQRGAYYTPLPLATFMLDTLNRRYPLKPGMRVLDPACGSGVFLVQCFRLLIEHAIQNTGVIPRPTALRDLLTQAIFGVDCDPDACGIAELSLILTLLDYIRPPDLSNTTFKLPALRDTNILRQNAFESVAFRNSVTSFDWVVGNPPWKEPRKTTTDPHDQVALTWMNDNRATYPTSGNQLAEAFVWRSTELAKTGGAVCLLLPAMTLSKYEAEAFRRELVHFVQLWMVANFSNLAEVLFAGRSRVPAAAFFFTVCTGDERPDLQEDVLVFSPMVATQLANGPSASGRRVRTWNITVGEDEIRSVPYRAIWGGEALPWKLASWGSHRDARLLRFLESRFPSIRQFIEQGRLIVSAGLELREPGASRDDPVEAHPELANKPLLNVESLRESGRCFWLRPDLVSPIPANRAFVRRGRFALPISVCKAPHVIVSAARNWAFYTDSFCVIPPRQIGIVSQQKDVALLKALALYLNTDVALYHQFLVSPQLGVQRRRATLDALKELPIPFVDPDREALRPWTRIYDALVESDKKAYESRSLRPLDSAHSSLLDEANSLAESSLGLNKGGRAQVRDLVRVRLALNDGAVGEAAVGVATHAEMSGYAKALLAELGSFLGRRTSKRHAVSFVMTEDCGIVLVSLTDNPDEPSILHLRDGKLKGWIAEIKRAVRQGFPQWRYFNNNLRVLSDDGVIIVKGLERMFWTYTQAMNDAADIVSDVLSRTSKSRSRD